ncbi:MAG: HEAT repeat domain-containing protein [Prolixibacteraceae bacterium]
MNLMRLLLFTIIIAVIFSDRKRSFAELLRLREEGSLNPESQKFWEVKPVEELYDLKNDPHELNNLTGSEEYSDKLEEMRGLLRGKVMESCDIGFLHESEYMRRAEGSTPYEYAQSNRYNVDEIFKAAEMVGDKSVETEELLKKTEDEESGVRYWAVIALMQRLEKDADMINTLESLLNDSSPAVALASAEALCKLDRQEQALPVIEKCLKMDDEPTTVLNAAMVARRIGEDACPLADVVRSEFEKYQGDVWGRYKSWSYPMFIGFAFDQIRINCGEDLGNLKN